MTRPFLIIQLRPEDATADSEFNAIKRYGGLSDDEVQRHRADVSGLPDIDLDDFSAVIVGGSPFDVSTPATEKSEIQQKIEAGFAALLTEIEARDFPFLGACSGNGLLGNYCGARISPRFGEPVSVAEINLTEAGRSDPLLAGLPPTFQVRLGHKEACDDLPPRTELLAGNAACPVQMFRLKNNIYATQFHPEADQAEFELRINVYREFGYFPPATADQLIASLAGIETPEAHEILRRFVVRYRRE